MTDNGMRTITFYSYKGGTGRSLALAQLAACLAWLGRRVCVVDFDLESPGIHHKLQGLNSPYLSSLDKGLIEYMEQFVASCADDPSRLLNVKVSDLVDLRLKSVPIQFGRGQIDVIAAGSVLKHPHEYWEILTSSSIQNFLNVSAPFGGFFEALKLRIAQDLESDYLLIDSRSGVNELSGICTQILPDKVVVFFGCNDEGVLGTNMILKLLAEDPEQPPLSSIYTAALSRIPESYIDESGKTQLLLRDARNELLAEYLRKVNAGLDPNDRIETLHPLTNAPFLQLHERLPLMFGKHASIHSQLIPDYVALFSYLLREEEQELRVQLRPYVASVRVLRPYLLVEDEGKMINPDDDSWNVAFRVDTMTTLMSSLVEPIVELMQESGSDHATAVEAAQKKLFHVGELAATRFSAVLQEEWSHLNPEGKTPSNPTKLEDWCHFDSSVGFGVFEPRTWGAGMEGTITLHNNFLLYGRSEADFNLCAYMRGYISRVLDAIFYPATVQVTHNLETDCAQYKPGESACVFSFEVVDGSPTSGDERNRDAK